jgi:hypothetical protein
MHTNKRRKTQFLHSCKIRVIRGQLLGMKKVMHGEIGMTEKSMIGARLLSLLAAVFVVGCEHDHRPPPPREVVVEQGYYYDDEYYDADHHLHPRQYYFYDGHNYVPHDAPPHDVVVHERAVRVDPHRGGELHEGDRQPPGAELHGGDADHDDRGGQLPPREH